MKIITIFWILLIAGFLFGVIGKIIKKEKFRFLENTSIYHKWFLVGYVIIFWFIIYINENYDYETSHLRQTREEYSIPELENNMVLIKRTKNKEIWQDIKTDTICFHEFKVIDFDFNGVFKEVDFYRNSETNQILIIENYLPGFFRKHKVKYYIKNIQGNYKLKTRDASLIEKEDVQHWCLNN